jgi:hypothetical protein
MTGCGMPGDHFIPLCPTGQLLRYTLSSTHLFGYSGPQQSLSAAMDITHRYEEVDCSFLFPLLFTYRLVTFLP